MTGSFTRRRAPMMALVVLSGLCWLALGAAAAYAGPPSITLKGSGIAGPTPDSYGGTQVFPNATLTGSVASGTFETRGRYGGIGNDSYDAFSGKVTCMLQKGNRVFVGGLGTATQHEETGGKIIVTTIPGSYMQVMEVEFGHYFTDPQRTNHAIASLGTHQIGLPSTVAPKCKAYVSKLKGAQPAVQDTLNLSPSITKPADGATVTAGPVKFAGTGEPNTAIRLDEGSETTGADVSVNANGKWSVTLEVVGEMSFTARAVGGSTVPSNTVTLNASL
jgi:hypothetical protein